MEEEKLKSRIELLKMHSFFIIGLTTGLVSLLLRDDLLDNKIVSNLSIVAAVILIAILSIFLRIYFKINKILK